MVATQRSMKIESREAVPGGQNLIVVITQARKTARYTVRHRSSGTEWIEVGGSEIYDVTNNGCTCMGHTNHGHCKHMDATQKLIKLKKLSNKFHGC